MSSAMALINKDNGNINNGASATSTSFPKSSVLFRDTVLSKDVSHSTNLTFLPVPTLDDQENPVLETGWIGLTCGVCSKAEMKTLSSSSSLPSQSTKKTKEEKIRKKVSSSSRKSPSSKKSTSTMKKSDKEDDDDDDDDEATDEEEDEETEEQEQQEKAEEIPVMQNNNKSFIEEIVSTTQQIDIPSNAYFHLSANQRTLYAIFGLGSALNVLALDLLPKNSHNNSNNYQRNQRKNGNKTKNSSPKQNNNNNNNFANSPKKSWRSINMTCFFPDPVEPSSPSANQHRSNNNNNNDRINTLFGRDDAFSSSKGKIPWNKVSPQLYDLPFDTESCAWWSVGENSSPNSPPPILFCHAYSIPTSSASTSATPGSAVVHHQNNSAEQNFGMLRVIDLQNKTVSLLCCTVHPYCPKLNLSQHGICLFGLNQGSSDHSIGLIFGGYNILSGVNQNNANGARNTLVLVGQNIPHYNQRKRRIKEEIFNLDDDDENNKNGDDDDDEAGTCYYETDSDDDEEFESDPAAVTFFPITIIPPQVFLGPLHCIHAFIQQQQQQPQQNPSHSQQSKQRRASSVSTRNMSTTDDEQQQQDAKNSTNTVLPDLSSPASQRKSSNNHKRNKQNSDEVEDDDEDYNDDSSNNFGNEQQQQQQRQDEDPVIYAIGDQRAFELPVEKIRQHLLKKELEAENFIALTTGQQSNKNNNSVNNNNNNDEDNDATITSINSKQANTATTPEDSRNDLRSFIKNTPPATASEIEQWNRWWSFVKPKNPQDVTICKIPHVAVQQQNFTLATSRVLRTSFTAATPNHHNGVTASNNINSSKENNNNNQQTFFSRKPDAVLVSGDGRAVYVFSGGSWHGPMRVSNPQNPQNNNTTSNSNSFSSLLDDPLNNQEKKNRSSRLLTYQIDGNFMDAGRSTPVNMKLIQATSAKNATIGGGSSTRPASATSTCNTAKYQYGLDGDRPPSLPSWAIARAASSSSSSTITAAENNHQPKQLPDLSAIPDVPESSARAKRLLAASPRILMPAKPIIMNEPITPKARHDHRVAHQVVSGFLHARRKERSVFAALKKFASDEQKEKDQNENNNNQQSRPGTAMTIVSNATTTSTSYNNHALTRTSNNHNNQKSSRPLSSTSKKTRPVSSSSSSHRANNNIFSATTTKSESYYVAKENENREEGLLDLRECCPADVDDWMVLQHFASVHSKIRRLDVRGEVLEGNSSTSNNNNNDNSTTSSDVTLSLFLNAVSTLPFLTRVDFSSKVFVTAALNAECNKNSNNNSNSYNTKNPTSSTGKSKPVLNLDDPYAAQKKKNILLGQIQEREKREQFYKQNQLQKQQESKTSSSPSRKSPAAAAPRTSSSNHASPFSPTRAQLQKVKIQSCAQFEQLEGIIRSNIFNVESHERDLIMKRFAKVYQVLAEEYNAYCEKASAAESMNDYFYSVHASTRFVEEDMIDRKWICLEEEFERHRLWSAFSAATKERYVMSHYFSCVRELIFAGEELERLTLRVNQDRSREVTRIDSKADLAEAVERKNRRVAYERTLRGQREEIKREETSARNVTRAEEDKEKVQLFGRLNAIYFEVHDRIEKEKAREALEAQRKVEQENARRAEEQRDKDRIAEREMMHEHQLESLVTESMKSRDAIFHEWTDSRKRTIQSFRVMKALVDRFDAFVLRHAQRERCALLPPDLQVSSLPSQISIAAGNQMPVSICNLSGVMVEPIVSSKLEEVPKYMQKGNPPLENGELVLQQWTSRKSSLLAARVVVQMESFYPHVELVMAPKSDSGIKIVGMKDRSGPLEIYISGYEEPVGYVHYYPPKMSVGTADSDEDEDDEEDDAEGNGDDEDETLECDEEGNDETNNSDIGDLDNDDGDDEGAQTRNNKKIQQQQKSKQQQQHSDADSEVEVAGEIDLSKGRNNSESILSREAERKEKRLERQKQRKLQKQRSSSSPSHVPENNNQPSSLLPEPAALVFEIFLSTRSHLAQGPDVMKKLQQQLLLLRSSRFTNNHNNNNQFMMKEAGSPAASLQFHNNMSFSANPEQQQQNQFLTSPMKTSNNNKNGFDVSMNNNNNNQNQNNSADLFTNQNIFLQHQTVLSSISPEKLLAKLIACVSIVQTCDATAYSMMSVTNQQSQQKKHNHARDLVSSTAKMMMMAMATTNNNSNTAAPVATTTTNVAQKPSNAAENNNHGKNHSSAPSSPAIATTTAPAKPLVIANSNDPVAFVNSLENSKMSLIITVTAHSPNFLKSSQPLPAFRDEMSATEFPVPPQFAKGTFALSRMAASVASKEIEDEIVAHWNHASRTFNKNALLVPPLGELRKMTKHTTISRWSDRLDVSVMNLVIWRKPSPFEIDSQYRLYQQLIMAAFFVHQQQQQQQLQINNNNNNILGLTLTQSQSSASSFRSKNNNNNSSAESGEFNNNQTPMMSLAKRKRMLRDEIANATTTTNSIFGIPSVSSISNHINSNLGTATATSNSSHHHHNHHHSASPTISSLIPQSSLLMTSSESSPSSQQTQKLYVHGKGNFLQCFEHVDLRCDHVLPSIGSLSWGNNNNTSNVTTGPSSANNTNNNNPSAIHKAQYENLISLLTSTLTRMNGTMIIQFDESQKSSHDDEDCLVLKTLTTQFPSQQQPQLLPSSAAGCDNSNNNNTGDYNNSPSSTFASANKILLPIICANMELSTEILTNNNNPVNNNNSASTTLGLVPKIIEVPSSIDPMKTNYHVVLFWKNQPLVVVEQRGALEIPGVSSSYSLENNVVRSQGGTWQVDSTGLGNNNADASTVLPFGHYSNENDNHNNNNNNNNGVTFMVDPSPEPPSSRLFFQQPQHATTTTTTNPSSMPKQNHPTNPTQQQQQQQQQQALLNTICGASPKSFDPCVLKICDGASVDGLRWLLQSVYFYNSAKPQLQQRPIEGPRRIVAGIRLRAGLESFVSTSVDVVSLVANSVFDFSAAPVVPYRSVPRLCDWKYLRYCNFQNKDPLFHFAATCSVLRDCETYLSDPDGPATLDVEILNPHVADMLCFDFAEESFVAYNLGVVGASSAAGINYGMMSAMLDGFEDENCVTKIVMAKDKPFFVVGQNNNNGSTNNSFAPSSSSSRKKLSYENNVIGGDENNNNNLPASQKDFSSSSSVAATFWANSSSNNNNVSKGRKNSGFAGTQSNTNNVLLLAISPTSSQQQQPSQQQRKQRVSFLASSTTQTPEIHFGKDTDNSNNNTKSEKSDEETDTNLHTNNNNNNNESENQQDSEDDYFINSNENNVLAEARHLQPQHLRIVLKQGKWTRDLLQQLVRALVFCTHASTARNVTLKKTPPPLEVAATMTSGTTSTSTTTTSGSTSAKQNRQVANQFSHILAQHTVHLQQDPYHYNQKHSTGPTRIVQFRLTSPSNLMSISDPPSMSPAGSQNNNNNNVSPQHQQNQVYYSSQRRGSNFNVGNNNREQQQQQPKEGATSNYQHSTLNQNNFLAVSPNVSPSPARGNNNQVQNNNNNRRLSSFFVSQQDLLNNTSFGGNNINGGGAASVTSTAAPSLSMARDTASILWRSPARDTYGFTRTFEESLLGIAKSSICIRPTKPLAWIDGRRLLAKNNKQLMLLNTNNNNNNNNEDPNNTSPSNTINTIKPLETLLLGNNQGNNNNQTDSYSPASSPQREISGGLAHGESPMTADELNSYLLNGKEDSISGLVASSSSFRDNYGSFANTIISVRKTLLHETRKKHAEMMKLKRKNKNKSHDWKYIEGAGAIPVAHLTILEEETSWEGGRIVVEIVDGCEEDDIILIQESLLSLGGNNSGAGGTTTANSNNTFGTWSVSGDETSNNNNNNNEEPSTTTTAAMTNSNTNNLLNENNTSTTSTSPSKNKATSRSSSTNNNGNQQSTASPVQPSAATAGANGDLLSKKQITEWTSSSTASASAIRKRDLEIKQAQEEIERRKKSPIRTRVEKTLYFNKIKVATIVFLPGRLLIQFVTSKKQQSLFDLNNGNNSNSAFNFFSQSYFGGGGGGGGGEKLSNTSLALYAMNNNTNAPPVSGALIPVPPALSANNNTNNTTTPSSRRRPVTAGTTVATAASKTTAASKRAQQQSAPSPSNTTTTTTTATAITTSALPLQQQSTTSGGETTTVSLSSNPCRNIRRRDINLLLQSICFASVSDNVDEGAKKVIAVRIKDSTSPEFYDFSTITMEAVDDPTEFRRPTAAPVSLKVSSDEDREGFAPFNDVTLYDPDTFSFNGTTLKAEIVSGGDYKGDVISVLSIARQKALRGEDTPIISTGGGDGDGDDENLGSNGSGGTGKSPITALFYNGRKIAVVEFETRGQMGTPCRVSINFVALAEMTDEMIASARENSSAILRLKNDTNNNNNTTLEIHSDDDNDDNNDNIDETNEKQEQEKKQEEIPEEEALNPDLVTLSMVELVLRSLRFQCANPFVRAGNRLLRGQLLVADVESHVDIVVQVSPPLLSNPDWHVSRNFILGTPAIFPAVVAPGIVLNVSEKVAIKKAKIAISFEESTMIEGHDKLDLYLTKGGFITLGKKGVLWSKEFLCTIQIGSPNNVLVMNLDQKDSASGFNATHLQALLRSIAFHTTSQITGPRQIQMFVQIDNNRSYRYDTSIHVLAPDDVRVDRVFLRQTKIVVTRGLKQPHNILNGLELFVLPIESSSGGGGGRGGNNNNNPSESNSNQNTGAISLMAKSGFDPNLNNQNSAMAAVVQQHVGDGLGGPPVSLYRGGEIYVHLIGGGIRENDKLSVQGIAHLDENIRPTAVIYGESITTTTTALANNPTLNSSSSVNDHNSNNNDNNNNKRKDLDDSCSEASFSASCTPTMATSTHFGASATSTQRQELCRVTISNRGRTLRFDLSHLGNVTSVDVQHFLRRVGCSIPQSENPRNDHSSRRTLLIVFDLDRAPRHLVRADVEILAPLVTCQTATLTITPPPATAAAAAGNNSNNNNNNNVHAASTTSFGKSTNNNNNPGASTTTNASPSLLLHQQQQPVSEFKVFDGASTNPKMFAKGVTVVITASKVPKSNNNNNNGKSVNADKSFNPSPMFTPTSAMPPSALQHQQNRRSSVAAFVASTTNNVASHQQQQQQKDSEENHNNNNDGYRLPFVLDLGSYLVNSSNINPESGVVIRNSGDLIPPNNANFKEQQQEVLKHLFSNGGTDFSSQQNINNNNSTGESLSPTNKRKLSPKPPQVAKTATTANARRPSTAGGAVTGTSNKNSATMSNADLEAQTQLQQHQLSIIQNSGNRPLISLFPQIPPLQNSTKPAQIFVDGKKVGIIERFDSHQLQIFINPDLKAAAYLEKIFKAVYLSFHKPLTAMSTQTTNNNNNKEMLSFASTSLSTTPNFIAGNQNAGFDILVKATVTDSRKGTAEIFRTISVPENVDDFLQLRPLPPLLGTPKALKAHHLEKQKSFTMGSNTNNNNNNHGKTSPSNMTTIIPPVPPSTTSTTGQKKKSMNGKEDEIHEI